jgi:uncharacterized protein involved in response to NO
LRAEPYRKLFAAGLIFGSGGILLWPLYFGGWIAYPVGSHPHLMVLGFFLSFVSGFLMTALPRMSGAAPASGWETDLSVALIFLGCAAALSGKHAIAYSLSSLQFFNLAAFVLRRVRGRKQNPPMGFMFVPAGLLWGAFGSLASAWAVAPALVQLGKIGLQQAFLLNLVVGLGSRLIPFVTRAQRIDPTQAKPESRRAGFLVLAALNLTFLSEPFLFPGAVYAARAAVLLFVAVKMFSVLERRIEATVLGSGIRFSVWALIVGYAALAVFPGYRLEALHVVFIAGFSLLTLMIATRVVLSHGNRSLALEKKSPYIAGAVVVFAAAAIVRAAAWLPAASYLWLLALVLWTYGIGRFLKGASDDPV